ncbi:MAG TPA: SIS domain-containing protein [Polyangia bacterium]|nr:SIS domain-containing protein [Polyangia bacterium]
MSFRRFAEAYQDRFAAALARWDLAALERVAGVLAAARSRGARVLIAGNGGSAAIANHAECDASKGTHVDGAPPLDTRSLAANPSVLTALANERGYASVFADQVALYGRSGDVLLVVSSKGSSANVVAACEAARARGLVTVALVGFDGGALKNVADHVVHVAADNYGIVEDMHQACLHVVTQWLCAEATVARDAPPATPTRSPSGS